jgi:hypothetical protein
MCSAVNAGKWEGRLLVYNQGLCFKQPGANLNQVPVIHYIGALPSK